MANAELDLQNQIDYIDSVLFYDSEKLQVCNPFLGISQEALLVAIRKSLLELQEFKSAKLAKGQT